MLRTIEPRLHRRVGGTVLGIALALAPKASHAASDAAKAAWNVEVRGGACEGARSALVREVTLACAAVGSCRVAPAAEAELTATLACDDPAGPWSLTFDTRDGKRLSQTDLEGTTDDRVRGAAVAIAHDAAPERALALETLRSALPEHEDVSPVPRTSGKRLVLLAAGQARFDVDTKIFGGQVGGAVRAASFVWLTANVFGGRGTTQPFIFGRPEPVGTLGGAVGVAVGAPYSDGVFGAGLSFGGFARDTQDCCTARSAYFGELTVAVQVPRGPVRPFLAPSLFLGHLQAGVTLNLGISMPAF